MNLKIKLPNLNLDFPVYNGSGSFEYGEYQWVKMDFDNLPALTLKTSTLKSNITPEKRENLMNTNGLKVINSIGLQNPPIEGVIKKIKELKNKIHLPFVASAAGETIEEFVENTMLLSQQDVQAVEINMSCPNVENGLSFGVDPELVEKTVRAIKDKSHKPIYVKLTPNVTSIGDIAAAAERGGADAIIAINSLLGFVVEPKTGKPLLAKGYGGYTGHGIFPIALRAVHEIYKRVNIPIIGVGGVSSTQDVVDMMSAGATAVQVVSVLGQDPKFLAKLRKELPQLLDSIGVEDVNELIGRSHKFNLKKLYPDTYLRVKK